MPFFEDSGSCPKILAYTLAVINFKEPYLEDRSKQCNLCLKCTGAFVKWTFLVFITFFSENFVWCWRQYQTSNPKTCEPWPPKVTLLYWGISKFNLYCCLVSFNAKFFFLKSERRLVIILWISTHKILSLLTFMELLPAFCNK